MDRPSDLLVEVDNVKFHLHKVISHANNFIYRLWAFRIV